MSVNISKNTSISALVLFDWNFTMETPSLSFHLLPPSVSFGEWCRYHATPKIQAAGEMGVYSTW